MNENNTPTKITCPECGASINGESTVCNECGFPIEKPQSEIATKAKEPKLSAKQLGIVFCIVAIIYFIVGITRITNDNYAFYSEHYKECAEGYEDATREAKTAGWLLKSGYENIADTYQDMMDDDIKKIWTYRIEAIALCAIGVVLIILGVKKQGRIRRFQMALFNCPACGKRISDKAVSCPGCGHLIQPIKDEEVTHNPIKNNGNKKAIIAVALIAFVICAIWAYTDRKQNEDISSSFDYGGYNYVPKTGNAGALAQAESYLNSSAFSYTSLIEQLEYHGFSSAEAKYGADNCGANWKTQALKKAKSYLNSSAFSYSGLLEQLEYEGFTSDEAQYGVDNCNANWNEQAVKKAKSYIRSSSKLSKSDLIDQLEYEDFTYSQAKYGVDNCGGF